MLCKNPFVRDPTGKIFKASLLTGDKELALGGIPFPCGQCLPCRINKRRVWTHRLMLESYCHGDSVMITLTFDEEHIPADFSVHKRDVQLFLKRLRKAIQPRKIRYYAAGEYGSKSGRPHYHLIVFGLSLLQGDAIKACWPFGMVHVAEFNQYTAQYVAGYVTKKISRTDGDPRQKEFAIMSRKPGIGFPALNDIMKLLDNPQFQKFLKIKKDVPDGLRHGPSFFPFGRYLKEKLRKMMELEVEPDAFITEMQKKYFECLHNGKEHPLVDTLIAESVQRNRQIERRFKIYHNRDKI